MGLFFSYRVYWLWSSKMAIRLTLEEQQRTTTSMELYQTATFLHCSKSSLLSCYCITVHKTCTNVHLHQSTGSDYNPIQLVCVVQQDGSPNLDWICQKKHNTTISVHSQFQPVASTQCSTQCSTECTTQCTTQHTTQCSTHTAHTYNYLYITFTFSGTSCKSFSFFFGRITRFSPTRCAAKTLSFIPPTWINKPNE